MAVITHAHIGTRAHAVSNGKVSHGAGKDKFGVSVVTGSSGLQSQRTRSSINALRMRLHTIICSDTPQACGVSATLLLQRIESEPLRSSIVNIKLVILPILRRAFSDGSPAIANEKTAECQRRDVARVCVCYALLQLETWW